VVIASASGVRVVGPVDPEDFAKGIFAGPPWIPAGYRGSNSNLALAVGDFAGDGRREIAFSWGNTSLNQTWLNILSADPKSHVLQSVAQQLLIFHAANFLTEVSLAAGRLGSTSHDQLAVALYAFKSDESLFLTIRSFDFDSSLQPIQKDELVTDRPSGGEVVLQIGRFDPLSPYMQAAIKYDTGPHNVRLGVLSFDTALKIRAPKFTVVPVACSTPRLAVGNFSRTDPIPQNPSQMQPSLRLQLAIQTDSCTANSPIGLNIFNVDPPAAAGGDFTVAASPAYTKTTSDPNWVAYLGTPIVSGDVQGRSMILGEPSKIVIANTSQPSVIAAMPPMHVDYIAPAGSNDPTVLNVSAIPDGFRTFYETTSTEKDESSTTKTSSWGFGTFQSAEASVEIGSVEAGFGVKVGAAVQAAQELKQIAETSHETFRSKAFTARVETGFADHVWYTETRFNIYVYPVLGQTACPATKKNCSNADKLPLTIQYSGPDHTSYEDVAGNLIPWYQPPWEPGNVFSYPATFAQLQQVVGGIDKLSEDRTWKTDGSTRTEETSWTTEQTNGSSASFDQNYSFDRQLSVAGACCGRLVTGSVSAEVGLSTSTGFNDLNKSVATIGKSSGIGVTKPGTFLTPTNYNYAVTPYIFGQTPPATKLDNTNLQADVKTSGILRTAFAADPVRRDTGGWWRQAYTSAPDVALNHPSRWYIASLGLENPIPPNCRQVGARESTMDCAMLEPSYPNNPFLSLFHIMRGFFISNASAPGKGPQLTTARAGDRLALEARVYNYSLAPMPNGSSVHVRFYAQPWNANNHTPIGDSVLINGKDVVQGAIPPFSDDDGAPLNWVLASTTFDTTPYQNQYLTFWVVVWMQDSSGKLVPELGSHGLRTIPGVLKSLADVQTEDYSNNVGFYNAEFYVFPSDPAFEEALLHGEPGTIDVGKIQTSADSAMRGQIIDVSTMLSATNNGASGVTAVFYDGDPHAGGTAFGMERSPYVAQNGTYQVKAPFQGTACGTHQLFVVLGKDTPNEVLRRASPVRIVCPGSPQ
jgi:hypothetical protein